MTEDRSQRAEYRGWLSEVGAGFIPAHSVLMPGGDKPRPYILWSL